LLDDGSVVGMARSSTSIGGLRQQLRALKNRVTWLERAIKPAKKPISPDLNRARDQAEEKARYEALMEFYRKRNIEFYKRNPNWLASEIAQE
jgi:hypothetical protein